MEENQNVNENPQKKKMGKKKKIVIAIIALVVVAIATVAVLGFTGVIDFNFTKKSKADAGIEKVSEVFTEAATDLETELNDAGLAVKLLEKENLTEAEAAIDVSFDIKKFETEELSEDELEMVNDVIDLINQVEIGAAAKSDADGKLDVKLEAEVGEEKVSVEAAFDGEKIGVRSEELNEKWLSVDMKDIAEELDIDEESMEEIEKMVAEVQAFVEDLVLTEEEIEHFKSTYSNIIVDYITSLEIESEKDKIEVGDKEKSCTKTTITLDSDDIKNLLISCVESVEEDEKGQEIVKEKIKLVCDFLVENEDLFEGMYDAYDDYYYDDYYYDDYYDDYYYDDYYYDDYYADDYYYDDSYETDDYSPMDDVREFADSLDELFAKENFEMIKDAIDSMELGEVELIVETYSTLTTVYATNIIFDIEGEKLAIEMTFDGNTTNVTVGMKSSGMSMDMIEAVLVNEKNHKSIEIKASDDMEEYMEAEMRVKAACDITENNLKTTLEIDLGEEGNLVLTQDLNVKTNTETEYASTSSNNIKFYVPDVIDIDATVNVGMLFKTSNVTINDIEDSIDLTDAMMTGEPDETTVKELEQYVEDAIPNVKDILEGLKSIDIIEEYLGSDIDDMIEELDNFSFDEVTGVVTETPVAPDVEVQY